MTRREWFKRTALGTLGLIGLGAVEATAFEKDTFYFPQSDQATLINAWGEDGKPFTITTDSSETFPQHGVLIIDADPSCESDVPEPLQFIRFELRNETWK